MKKVLSLLILLVFQVIPQQDTNAQTINPPGETDIMHCRCKDDGCYAGNWISFRSECATGHGTVDCTEYAKNCKNYSGDSDIEE